MTILRSHHSFCGTFVKKVPMLEAHKTEILGHAQAQQHRNVPAKGPRPWNSPSDPVRSVHTDQTAGGVRKSKVRSRLLGNVGNVVKG